MNAIKKGEERDRQLNEQVRTIKIRLAQLRREREKPTMRLLNQRLLMTLEKVGRKLRAIQTKSTLEPGKSRIWFV
jgi:hypothetical protein